MQSYPFTSQVTYDEQGLPLYDRAVDSAFLRRVFAQYFSDGVFYQPSDALQVVAGSGMQVQVRPGACHIRGAMGIEQNQRTLTVPAAGTQPRVDTVVARLDLSQAVRSVDLYVISGTPAASPAAPALTRDSTTWELGLADILVGANVSTLSQSVITDTRLDTTRCGMVAQTMGTLDTGPFFAQLEDALAQLEQVIAGVEAGSEMMLKVIYDPAGGARQVAFADSVIPLTGGTVNGNLRATGNVSAAGRIYTGSDQGTTSGTPGVVLLPEGTVALKSADAARFQCFPNNSTGSPVQFSVTDGGFAFNNNGSFTGSLSAYNGWTLPRIQHGNLYVDVAADSAADFQITFPKAFPGAPDVVLTPRHSAESLGYDLRVKLKTVSATGATGMLYYGTSGTWIIHWVAIYG